MWARVSPYSGYKWNVGSSLALVSMCSQRSPCMSFKSCAVCLSFSQSVSCTQVEFGQQIFTRRRSVNIQHSCRCALQSSCMRLKLCAVCLSGCHLVIHSITDGMRVAAFYIGVRFCSSHCYCGEESSFSCTWTVMGAMVCDGTVARQCAGIRLERGRRHCGAKSWEACIGEL